MSPIQNSEIGVGKYVHVHEHGKGIIRGIGCCGHGRDKIHIEFEYGTTFHCDIDSLRNSRELSGKGLDKAEDQP